MAKVFSPTAPDAEIAGMKRAEEYFSQRAGFFTAAGVRGAGVVIGNRLRKTDPNFADGFERMAYIISQQTKE